MYPEYLVAPMREELTRVGFEELKDAGLSRVIFSVYGGTQEQHESVTLTEGSYCATLDAVLKCLALGFNVEFHFVPMSANFMALRSVAELARKLGVSQVSALRLVPQGRGADYAKLKLSRKENEMLRECKKTTNFNTFYACTMGKSV